MVQTRSPPRVARSRGKNIGDIGEDEELSHIRTDVEPHLDPAFPTLIDMEVKLLHRWEGTDLFVSYRKPLLRIR